MKFQLNHVKQQNIQPGDFIVRIAKKSGNKFKFYFNDLNGMFN